MSTQLVIPSVNDVKFQFKKEGGGGITLAQFACRHSDEIRLERLPHPLSVTEANTLLRYCVWIVSQENEHYGQERAFDLTGFVALIIKLGPPCIEGVLTAEYWHRKAARLCVQYGVALA